MVAIRRDFVELVFASLVANPRKMSAKYQVIVVRTYIRRSVRLNLWIKQSGMPQRGENKQWIDQAARGGRRECE